jgi:hypothetical protein
LTLCRAKEQVPLPVTADRNRLYELPVLHPGLLLDREEFSELFPQIDKKLLEDGIEMNLRAGEKFDLYY